MGTPVSNVQPPAPPWLREWLGKDFFADVVVVYLSPLAGDAGLEHLKGVGRIKELHVGGRRRLLTQVGTLQDGSADLEKLYIIANIKVTDAGLEHLEGLSKLEKLYLGSTEITDAGLTHLMRLTHLQDLSLVGTKVTDAGLPRLAGLSPLKDLSLVGTEVTEEGVTNLQQALPTAVSTMTSKPRATYWCYGLSHQRSGREAFCSTTPRRERPARRRRRASRSRRRAKTDGNTKEAGIPKSDTLQLTVANGTTVSAAMAVSRNSPGRVGISARLGGPIPRPRILSRPRV